MIKCYDLEKLSLKNYLVDKKNGFSLWFWSNTQICQANSYQKLKAKCYVCAKLKEHWTTSASSPNPIFFSKQVKIFIPLEVYAYVVTATQLAKMKKSIPDRSLPWNL